MQLVDKLSTCQIECMHMCFPKSNGYPKSYITFQIDNIAYVVSKKVQPKVNGNDCIITLKINSAITKRTKNGKKVKI